MITEWLYDYEERMKESKQIASIIDIKPNSKILEIGMGSGHLAHYLLKQGHTVFATNDIDDEIKDCHLNPYAHAISWKYEGTKTDVKRLQCFCEICNEFGYYDYIIANNNAMHSECGGEIHKEEDYEHLVKGLLNITRVGGEIWLGFNPSLNSEYMKQYKISTPNNLIGESVHKIERQQ